MLTFVNMISFDQKLKTLNERQRLAVETTEGPVMVIAGPGTGKTEILSLRIGHIIREGRAEPKDILCLTYTDAASTEMRQRLIEYIGPEAYRIQVSTFHAFCNLVIQENPGIFQQARELEPISEIDKFRLLQKLIDGFDPDHPLKKFKGQMYSDWKRLDGLFATMKKENWSPAHILQQVDAYVTRKRQSDDYVYKRKTGDFQKGDFNEKKFRDEVLDKMENLLAAVAEYDRYNTLLAENGQYDFDDMLLWVDQAFSRHPDLLANYQERFLYLLVDEFQDTNGIQISILHKLLQHEWIDRPNIFVVGDDDQAIYRFQGANIENLVAFYRAYQPEVIVLEENYRSSQLILDAARVIMHPVENSLMQSIFNQVKTLSAKSDHAGHDQPVIIQSYPKVTSENADIFRQLKHWQEQDLAGEVAVLYTKHELGRELAQALKGAGIPYHTSRTLDALHQPVIEHLLDILQCLFQLSTGADHDDALLYQILHLRYLEPRTADLQQLIIAYTSKEKDDPSTLYTWLGDPDKLSRLRLRHPEWMDRMYRLLEDGIIEYHSRSLLSFTEWVIHAFGIMSWILEQKEKFPHLYTLKTFYTFIDRQSSGKSRFAVPDLLEIAELMNTYGIRLPVHELAHPDKGIHLSTLHGAKGLQFDKVIIKDLTENEWEKKRAWNQSFSFPDNLVRRNSLSEWLESGMDTEDQDRRRLLYVGMTRAKKDLILTYAASKDDGKGMTPSLYVSEIEKKDPQVRKIKTTTDENAQGEYLAAFMSGEQRARLHTDTAEIRDRVKNYVLNVSALNTYIECPVRFYYEKILQIPATEATPLLFGTCLHDALQVFFRKRFKEHDPSKGRAFLTDTFAWYMERKAHRFTEKELSDLTTYGQKCLSEFYDQYHSRWSDQVTYELEYKINDVHIEGIPVKGFIDRVDRTGDAVIVIDYKSGRADSIAKKLNRPREQDPGGHYWRQMVFYDLLLRQDLRIRRGMTAGYILSLEPLRDGRYVEKKVEITEEDRDLVTRQIVEVYQKIQAMDFAHGCGECGWCRMHDLRPPMMELTEEEG